MAVAKKETKKKELVEEVEEQIDLNELLFAEGPTLAQVEDWKSRYKGDVFMSDIGNKTYIWRPLIRQEYKSLNRANNPGEDAYYKEEKVCEMCVLFPKDGMSLRSDGLAGVPTVLFELIMDKSGFDNTAQAIKL